MELTPEALVTLVRQLRGLGVTRLRAGEVEVDIAPPPAPVVHVKEEPEPSDEDLLFHSADDRMPPMTEDDE